MLGLIGAAAESGGAQNNKLLAQLRESSKKRAAAEKAAEQLRGEKDMQAFAVRELEKILAAIATGKNSAGATSMPSDAN